MPSMPPIPAKISFLGAEMNLPKGEVKFISLSQLRRIGSHLPAISFFYYSDSIILETHHNYVLLSTDSIHTKPYHPSVKITTSGDSHVHVYDRSDQHLCKITITVDFGFPEDELSNAETLLKEMTDYKRPKNDFEASLLCSSFKERGLSLKKYTEDMAQRHIELKSLLQREEDILSKLTRIRSQLVRLQDSAERQVYQEPEIESSDEDSVSLKFKHGHHYTLDSKQQVQEEINKYKSGNLPHTFMTIQCKAPDYLKDSKEELHIYDFNGVTRYKLLREVPDSSAHNYKNTIIVPLVYNSLTKSGRIQVFPKRITIPKGSSFYLSCERVEAKEDYFLECGSGVTSVELYSGRTAAKYLISVHKPFQEAQDIETLIVDSDPDDDSTLADHATLAIEKDNTDAPDASGDSITSGETHVHRPPKTNRYKRIKYQNSSETGKTASEEAAAASKEAVAASKEAAAASKEAVAASDEAAPHTESDVGFFWSLLP